VHILENNTVLTFTRYYKTINKINYRQPVPMKRTS